MNDENIKEYDDPQIIHGPFYALSFRNFRLFFIGQFISVAGSWMQVVAQSWLVYEITKSPAWLGIVSGAGAIPYVLFSIWGGQVADRHSKRIILIWTQTLSMLAAFLIAALATNRWVHIEAWQIAVISAALGLVNAFNMPAQQAFVIDMVDKKDAMGNAIALNSLQFNIARFAGPILAGVVLAKMGATMCFFLNGLSFVAVIISLMMMRVEVQERHSSQIEIWGGLDYTLRNHTALRIITLIGCASLFTWSAGTLFPVFADRLHEGATGYSAMLAFNGIGAALGGLLIASVGARIPRLVVIYAGSFLFCFTLILFAMTPHYYPALALLALSGMGMVLFGISSNTKVQEDVPDILRGRVMAIYSLVMGGLMPVGGLEIGFLAQRVGPVLAMEINAWLCVLCTISMIVWQFLDKPVQINAIEELS
jgi:MFS family permease